MGFAIFMNLLALLICGVSLVIHMSEGNVGISCIMIICMVVNLACLIMNITQL
jgi:hypothetical protein